MQSQLKFGLLEEKLGVRSSIFNYARVSHDRTPLTQIIFWNLFKPLALILTVRLIHCSDLSTVIYFLLTFLVLLFLGILVKSPNKKKKNRLFLICGFASYNNLKSFIANYCPVLSWSCDIGNLLCNYFLVKITSNHGKIHNVHFKS